MNNIKKIVFAAALSLSSMASYAQDIHFSQFYENSILRNPALTGIFSGDFKFGVNYRSQWGSISNPFTTVSFSGETRILTNANTADYISFGLAAYSDKAGTINFKSQGVYPTIAYNKSLEDVHNTYLSAGFTFGYQNRSVDMNKMTFSSQAVGGVYNSYNASGENAPFKNTNNLDVGAGLSVNSSIGTDNSCNYYVAASLYHINRPSQVFNGGYSNVRLPMKWQLSAGMNFIMSENWSMTLHGNFSAQGASREGVYGGLLSYHSALPFQESDFAFSFGSFARSTTTGGDAVIPTVQMAFKNVTVGASYDVTNSTLATSSNTSTGAMEMTLFVRGNYAHKLNPQDNIRCPRFERPIHYPFNN